uniref:Uncharacterized protein n=1 Tax=Anguilla anguilla TaxID=7936 RepID=A0A0E9U7T2_ANGAN
MGYQYSTRCSFLVLSLLTYPQLTDSKWCIKSTRMTISSLRNT